MILTMSARTYNIIWNPLKKFLRHFKVSPHVFKRLNLGHFRPQMGIKPKKSPLECVLKHSFRLRRPMTTPFALADSLGPKHVRKDLQWCSKCPRKFFGAISRPMVNSQKFNFRSFCFKIAPKWPLKPQNHPRVAFRPVECDWEVVRHPNRILRVQTRPSGDFGVSKVIWEQFWSKLT